MDISEQRDRVRRALASAETDPTGTVITAEPRSSNPHCKHLDVVMAAHQRVMLLILGADRLPLQSQFSNARGRASAGVPSDSNGM